MTTSSTKATPGTSEPPHAGVIGGLGAEELGSAPDEVAMSVSLSEPAASEQV